MATDTPLPLPTDTPIPLPTDTPLPPPTETPEPAPPQPAAAQITVVLVDKRAEFVDLQNSGGQPQDLSGWTLISEKGNQACGLGGVIEAGAVLRVWALTADAGQAGYNYGFSSNIWNNSEPDPAVLYDNTGALVDRYP